MKLTHSLILAAALLLPIATQAQTNPPPSNIDTNGMISGPVWQVIDFLSEGTNWMIAPYGIVTTGGDHKTGAGFGVGYKLSEFVVPTLRIDYLDSSVWMPSGNLQLQVPMTIMNKVTMIPFVFTGIATPVSGRGNDNGSAVGIFGIGGALRVSRHWDAIFDVEKWTNFDNEQLRFGIVYKF